MSEQVPAQSRLTVRLRVQVERAVSRTNRAMSEVTADHDLAWWTTATPKRAGRE